jgi:DNA-directed RNA polymerase III subunit RPC4
MKFVPTLPLRRKKEYVRVVIHSSYVAYPGLQGGQASQCVFWLTQPNSPSLVDKVTLKETATQASTPSGSGASADRGNRPQGRGRGRGDASRGGRGAAPSRPPPHEMTASGPFAMGPSQVGSSTRFGGPRVTATPTMPRGPADAAALGANLSKTAAPTLKKERAERRVHVDEDAEVYSDPDEGVEIVDMRDVQAMDWMAPESLKWESRGEETKRVAKIKEVEGRASLKGKGAYIPFFWSSGSSRGDVNSIPTTKVKQEAMSVDGPIPAVDDVGDINLANALDLSDSEEEEEMENIIDDFSREREVNHYSASISEMN